MTNGYREGRTFVSHPHTNNGFFLLLSIKYCIFIFKKGFQKILNTLSYDIIWWRYFNNNNDITFLPTCGSLFFIFSTGWYRVWEVELSHMGKNSRNPNLVCKNNSILPYWLIDSHFFLIYCIFSKSTLLQKFGGTLTLVPQICVVMKMSAF